MLLIYRFLMALQLLNKWTHLPPDRFSKFESRYLVLIQFWMAIRQRYWALGQYIWPQTNFTWAQGVVGGIVQGADGKFVITDGSNNKWRPESPDFTGKTWAGGSAISVPYRPTSYDLIISFDDLDPSAQVRAHITDDTDPVLDMDGNVVTPGNVTVEDFSDYVTANAISSTGAANECKYYIIKENGLWWADRQASLGRWPDWPNSFEDDYGVTVQALKPDGTVYNDRVVLTSVGGIKPVPKLKGEDLLLYDTTGKLQRIKVTKVGASSINDTTVKTDWNKPILYFDPQSWQPDAKDYTVVAKNAMAFPGRTKVNSGPFWSYSGARLSYYAHNPDDSLTPHNTVAATTVSFKESEDLDSPCDDSTLVFPTALDEDVWSLVDIICSAADDPKSPFFYKSLRSIQHEVEQLCGSFVPPLNYPVTGRSPAQNFTVPLLMYLCGINSGTSPVLDKQTFSGESEPNYHIFVGTQWAGKSIGYTLLNSTKYIVRAGLQRVDSGATCRADGYISLGTGLYDAADEMSDPTHFSDVGQPVYWTAAWTEQRPKMFRNLYDAFMFIPDTDMGSAIFSVQNFAVSGCFGAGGSGTGWMKRPKSTALMIFDQTGIASDSGESFQVGDLAVYMGESWAYPISPATEAGDDDGSLEYWDRTTETVHPDKVQAALATDATSTIVSHTFYSFTANRDWWKSWFNGGETRVETGTCTSAGSTFFQDSTKATGEGNCYWQSSRFNGYAYPYEGFIVEIDHQGTTYKIPLTGADPSIVRADFNSVGVAFSSGDVYRIREPGTILNRYKGKKVRVTPTTGKSFTLTIQYSDRDTLYFNPTDVAQVGGFQDGWSFQIIEIYPGGVYQWSGTDWILPTGNDSRGGVKFRPTAAENAADWVKDYGKIKKFDYISIDVFDELFTTINALIWTPGNVVWISRFDNNTPENNYQIARSLDWSNFFFVYPEGDYASLGDMFSGSMKPGSGTGEPPFYRGGMVAQANSNWAGPVWTGGDPGGGPSAGMGETTEVNGNVNPGTGLPQKGPSSSPPPSRWCDVSVGEVRIDGIIDPTNPATGGMVIVHKSALYAYAMDTNVPTIISSKVDFLAFSLLAEGVSLGVQWTTEVIDNDSEQQDITIGTEGAFNAHGTPLLYASWVTFDPGSPGQSIIRISQKLGDLSQPNDPVLFQPVSGYGTEFTNDFTEQISAGSVQGYAVVGQLDIRKWNIKGGMTFIGSFTVATGIDTRDKAPQTP